MALGRTFTQGFQAGGNIAQGFRQQQLAQQQAAREQRDKLFEAWQDQFNSAVQEAAKIKKSKDMGNPDAEAALDTFIERNKQRFAQSAQRLQQMNYPVSPEMVAGTFDRVRLIPTPQQEAQVKAQEKFQLAAAKEQGTRSVQPQMRVVSGDTALGQSLGIPDGEMARVEIPQDGSEPRVVARFGAPSEINISPGPSAFQEQRGQDIAKTIQGIIDRGQEAVVTEQKGRQLAELLKSGVSTGQLQPTFAFIQGIADDLGVDISEAAQDAGIESLSSLDKKEEFDRLSKQIIIRGFEQFKGNLNQKEVEIAMDAYQNLGRSEDANIEAVASLLASQVIAKRRAMQARTVQTQAESQELLGRIFSDDVEEFNRLKKSFAEEMREARGQQSPQEPEMELDEETQRLLDKYSGENNGNP